MGPGRRPYLPGATDTARLFAAALSAGQDLGDVRPDVDAHIGGLVMLAAAVGALVRWAADEPAQPGRPDLRSAMLAATEIVLRGLLTRQPPGPGNPAVRSRR